MNQDSHNFASMTAAASPRPLGDAATVVTVLYESAAVAPDMIRAIAPCAPVIAVDNASSDDGVARAAAERATIVKLDQNFGFGAANNIGVAAAETPFVFLANPDLRFSEADLARLVAALDADDRLIAVGPLLQTGDGEATQKTVNMTLPKQTDGAPRCLSGAALLIRRDAFLALGGFDADLFLYGEEDDFFNRALQAGWRISVVADVRIRHWHGASSAPTSRVRWLKAYHFSASRLFLERKHGLRKTPLREFRRGLIRAVAGLLQLSKDKTVHGGARMAAAAMSLRGRPPNPHAETASKLLKRQIEQNQQAG